LPRFLCLSALSIMGLSSKNIIRFIGLILIVWGLWTIISEYQRTWSSARYGILSSIADPEFIPFIILFLLYNVILPLCALVSARGLLGLKPWGRISALVISLLLFIHAAFESIFFVVRRFSSRDLPIPQTPDGTIVIVGYVSMWPAFITVLLSALIVYILTREPIKRDFCKR